MKTVNAPNEYHNNGVLEHNTFRVANSAFLMEMLSDMYSDRVRAVIRELSANAWDAHQLDGHNEPFEVFLPTTDKPQFKVRDFGTGLSLQEFESLYTTYGASNKRQTNEMVGGFGIGSKSPFAYTGMWTVISYYNGKKYTIVNSKDNNSRFCYDLLAEEDTTEQNGLEVSFTVNSKDIYDFHNKATDIFQYFKVKPTFTNWKPTFKNIEILDSGPNWEIQDGGTAYVVLGQISYPIHSSHFNGNSYTILREAHPILYFDIGEIQITPSREALNYTQDTKDKINTRLTEIYDKIKKDAEEAIKNCSCLWDARLLARDYFAGKRTYVGVILNKSVVFNGQTINSTNYINDNCSKGSLQLRKFYVNGGLATEKRAYIHINIRPETEFAIVDSQGAYAAAKRYVLANPNSELYVFTPFEKDIGHPPVKTKITVDDFVDTIGIDKGRLLLTSSFPKHVKVPGQIKPKVKRAKNVIKAYKFNPTNQYSHIDRYNWKDQDIDLDNDSGYYCHLYKFLIDGKISINADVKDIFKSHNVIGVPESKIDLFKKRPHWKEVKILFKDVIDKLTSNADVLKYFDTNVTYNFDCLVKEYKHLKSKKLDSVFSDYKNYKKVENDIAMYKTYIALYRSLGGSYVSPIVTPFKFDVDSICPILEFISPYHYGKQVVIDTINKLS